MSHAARIWGSFLLALVLSGCGASSEVADEPRPGPVAEEPEAAAPPSEERVTPAAPVAAKPRAGRLHRVAAVSDGDTIRLASGARVRLVQIDTPEVFRSAECGGRQASAALKAQLPAGTAVTLVHDPVSDNADSYGRLLRYVYKGSRNLNAWMVASGHAAPYFYDGERGRFAPQLERAARRAKAQRLGIWGRCPQAVLDTARGVTTGSVPSGPADAAAGAAQITRGGGQEPPYPPDLDCSDFDAPVSVSPADPHRLDADGDGIGCD